METSINRRGKCQCFAPKFSTILTAYALTVALTAESAPWIIIRAHGPDGWKDYRGLLLSIEREDGSGKSFNVILTDENGFERKLYVRFE